MPLIDYLVLTPLDEEWDVTAGVIFPTAPFERSIEAITYYLGRFTFDRADDAGAEYLIVGAPMAHRTPGQAYASSFCAQSLKNWKPSRVALLGIAGSLEPDVLLLGDVVVSNAVWGFEVGDAVGRNVTFRKTFNQIGALDLDRVRAFKRSLDDYPSWQDECLTIGEALGLKVPRPPELHIKTTASGNVVVKSVTMGKKLKQQISMDIVAVEMEARGLHQALYLDAHNTDSLMLRGISDYADRNKSKLERASKSSWRTFAAGNAARALRSLWRREPVPALSSAVVFDLTHGSLNDMRRWRDPPIPDIEFRQIGAQDIVFPRFIMHQQPTSEIQLRVSPTWPAEARSSDCRGQCLIAGGIDRIVMGKRNSEGEMSFRIPQNEDGLQVELQLSFLNTVQELRFDLVDAFARTTTEIWKNPVFLGGG